MNIKLNNPELWSWLWLAVAAYFGYVAGDGVSLALYFAMAAIISVNYHNTASVHKRIDKLNNKEETK